MARGQAFTLEGVAASLLVLVGLLLALQTTVVTPLAATTANEHLGNQMGAGAEGVLDVTAENGSIRAALLAWNETEGSFYDATARGYYVTGGPPNQFGRQLERTFGDSALAYNVVLTYRTPGGQGRQVSMVHFGTPPDDAVSATRTVTLYDEDQLYAENGSRLDTTLANASTFFAPDAAEGPVYNVVEVEVVVWQK
jgi:hypothetical protein